MLDLIVNTSYLNAIMIFGLVYMIITKMHPAYTKSILYFYASSWAFLGVCYTLTQFGGDWFISYQRVYFRVAITWLILARAVTIAHATRVK